MQLRTREHLLTSMRGEAFAYAKYILYAQHARAHGHTDLAELFERTAMTELTEHVPEQADLLGLLGTDVEHLRDAIAGETYEIDTMYQQFIEDATRDGDQAAAERFDEVRQDEIKHREAFTAALKHLEAAAPIN